MDNWTAPKYTFMKHTIVLGGSQFTRVSMGRWLLRLSAKILALLRLSVIFFSVTVNEKVKY